MRFLRAGGTKRAGHADELSSLVNFGFGNLIEFKPASHQSALLEVRLMLN